MAGHKDPGDGLPEANRDRKAGSEPSAPSLEREGREPRKAQALGYSNGRWSQQRTTQPHGNIMFHILYKATWRHGHHKERLMCVSHARQRERELDYLYTWLSRKNRA